MNAAPRDAHGVRPPARAPLFPTRLAPTLALTLVGEAAQSAFHFAVNVVLARRLAVADYGVFAVVMVIGAVALTYMRALVGMPAALLVSEALAAGRVRAARAIGAACGARAALLALLIAAVCAPLIGLWLREAALSGALFIGLWSFRSYLRALLLASGRRRASVAGDLTFAIAGSALAAPAILLVSPGAGAALDAAFLALAGANLAAVAAMLEGTTRGGALRPRSTLRRGAGIRSAVSHRQLAWSAAATTATNLQATGQVLLVAVVGGPGIYAPMAAMLALFAPVRLLTAGLTNMLLPELAARPPVDRVTPASFRAGHALARWTAWALATGLIYGAAAAAALPLMGTTVFGGQPRSLVFALAWGTTTAFFLSLVPRLLLEVRRRFRDAAAIGAVGAAAGMVVVTLVLRTGHPAWALSGNLVAETIVLAGTWLAVGCASRAPAAAGPDPGPAAVRPRWAPVRPRRSAEGVRSGRRTHTLGG